MALFVVKASIYYLFLCEMGLKDLWERFSEFSFIKNTIFVENKLGSKSEEPTYFGVKNFQFTLQTNDGFQMEVDPQTAFQSLRLRSMIKVSKMTDSTNCLGKWIRRSTRPILRSTNCPQWNPKRKTPSARMF